MKLLLFILNILFFIKCGHCCSCVATSDANKFCAADFAAQIKLLDIKVRNESDNTTGLIRQSYQYKIELIEFYKNSSKVTSDVDLNNIYTRVDSATCGVWLERHQNTSDNYYFVSGYISDKKEMSISLCGWNQAWSQISSRVKRRLEDNTMNMLCRSATRTISVSQALISFLLFFCFTIPIIYE